VTIRPCAHGDFDDLFGVINAAAVAYEGVIPADCCHRPYMPAEELKGEIEDGVRFWGCYEADPDAATSGRDRLAGVMGIQDVDDVTLIRHAYVRPERQGEGIGSGLLTHLVALTQPPLLVGTWSDAVWAVSFYQRRGFRLVTPAEKDRLLRRYWRIPERQVETSVVLRLDEAGPPGAA